MGEFPPQFNLYPLLVDELVAAGRHEVRFDARTLASGIYCYRMRAGDTVFVRKVIVAQ